MEALGIVLVVEKDQQTQKKIRAALPKTLQLIFAENGKRAIEEAKSHEELTALLLGNAVQPGVESYELLSLVGLERALPILRLRSQANELRNAILAGQTVDQLKRIIEVPSIDQLDATLTRATRLNVFWKQAAAAFLDIQPEVPASEFTHAEQSVLTSVGFPVQSTISATPIAARAARFGEMLAKSLTTTQAAKKLKVNASRIRQRLTAKPPQLYGLRAGSQWRLADFQFGPRGLIPGIEKVIAALPQMDPVAVDTWFRATNIDLVRDRRKLSPLDWLAQGLPPEQVVALAKDL
jgi:hypothetical protein